MDKELAENIVQSASVIDKEFNNMTNLLRGMPKNDDNERALEALAEAVSIIYTSVTMKIFREFPDLNCDE